MFGHVLNNTKKLKLKSFVSVLVVCFVLLLPQHFALAGVFGTVEKFLFDFIVSVFGFFVGAAASLLDYAIKEMVIGFSNLYLSKGMGVAIDNLWVILRDFFNLTFIFGLVMIGLRTIFDSSNSSTRKMLISLILAALFVNFSLLITKLIVDFSNVAALQLVNSFAGGNISGAFMDLMGGQGIFSSDVLKYTEGSTGLVYIFGIMIIMIVMIFVFMAGALLIFIRFAALNLYMLLSPLMFIGMVFPGAMGVTRKYWSGFLSKAFFAPAYILMLYFSYKILAGFKYMGADSIGKALKGGGEISTLAVFPPFITISIFLIASVVVAQKMGMEGANGVIATGKMLTGKARKYAGQAAGGATMGLAARAGRQTLGRGASALARNQRFKNLAAKSSVAKGALATTRKVADSSFDARKVASIGKTFGIGEGRKGGYDTIAKEKTERDKKFAESLGEVETKDANGNLLPEVKEKASELRNTEPHQAENARVAELKAKADEAKADFEAEEAKKAQLETELAELKANADANPHSEGAFEAFKAKEAELNDFNANHVANIKKMQEVVNATAKAADTAEKAFVQKLESEAEGAIRFQNQLAFIQRRKNEAAWRERASGKFMGAVGGVGAGGVGAMLAGATAAPGIAITGGAAYLGHSIIAGGADTRRQSISALEKTYGKNGQNMVQRQKRKKRYEEERGFDKEFEDSGKKPKAEADAPDKTST